MRVYKAPIVQSLQVYYGNSLKPKVDHSIKDHLSSLAQKMLEGFESNEECVYTQINNYHPEFLGVSSDILKQKLFLLTDCQHAIANEYGFDSWQEVSILGSLKYNINFENCVNAIIQGDIDLLSNSILESPSLTKLQSNYGHKATLLHYTASNGVELWRQQVPQNLGAIIELLLANGSDKEAKMQVYGGEFSSYELFTTSSHPFDSGINTSIAELLKL